MRRAKKFLGLGVVLGLVVAFTTATAGYGSDDEHRNDDNHRNGSVIIRWDLPQVIDGVLLAGGTDVSTDAKSGDTVALTGSGAAEPGEREAAGGGTFLHKRANGTEFAHGVYYVTGFQSWRRLRGGTLDPTGLIDGIGNGPGANPNEHEPTSGVLRLKIHIVPDVKGVPQQPGVDGILIINCHLPNTKVFVPEGVEVRVPSFGLDFKPTSGVTIFHNLH